VLDSTTFSTTFPILIVYVYDMIDVYVSVGPIRYRIGCGGRYPGGGWPGRGIGYESMDRELQTLAPPLLPTPKLLPTSLTYAMPLVAKE
jgi:hypothetical protein